MRAWLRIGFGEEKLIISGDDHAYGVLSLAGPIECALNTFSASGYLYIEIRLLTRNKTEARKRQTTVNDAAPDIKIAHMRCLHEQRCC